MIEATDLKNEAQAPEPAGSEGSVHPRHERTCVGCGEKCAPGEMVRLVLGPSGEIAVDAAGGGFGRGAHVHARASCIREAAPRGLLRATKGKAATVCVAVKDEGAVAVSGPVPLAPEALARAIEAAMARRIAGLLSTSVRTRKVRIGADAVTAAWREGQAALVVVATDAAAGADLTAVREAVAAGAAVAWGTKRSLAHGLHRPDTGEGVAVAAITDTRIAEAVRDAAVKAAGTRGSGSGSAPKGGGKPATGAGNRGKLETKRAGRASGRRARGNAVVERSE